MKTVKKHHPLIPVLLAIGPTLFWTQNAQASSSFNGSATLTYTIHGITNLDNAGSLSGLALTGSFELAAAPNYSLTLSGDGAVNGNNLNSGPIALPLISSGISFNHPFALSGNVTNGTVNTSQLGLFGLNFENTGNDNYSISVALNYRLNSSAGGQFADSSVALDYYNENASFSGSDRIDTSIYAQQAAEWLGSSGVFNFALAPGATEALYADVRITGNLEASPVPLPGGFWLLFSGLTALYSLGKKQRRTV